MTTAAGISRPPISTGTGSTQKVDYITANNTTKLTVRAQYGSSSYSSMNVALSGSDVRLKKNICNVNIKALPVINSIKIRQFNWKQNNSFQKIGFIADELEELDPQFTIGGGYDVDGTMNVKCVDSFYLQGYEVKAIQELSHLNSSLISENQSLKNEILMLQGQLSLINQRLQKLEEKAC